MIDANLPLEIISGAGALLEFLFLLGLVQYLRKECIRRALTKTDMMLLRFPPSMNLAVALLTFDTGVTIQRGIIWAWRAFYDGGDLSRLQIAGIAFGGLLIVVGGLCKIRSVTQPDLGAGPWIVSMILVVLFVVLSLVFR